MFRKFWNEKLSVNNRPNIDNFRARFSTKKTFSQLNKPSLTKSEPVMDVIVETFQLLIFKIFSKC